MVRHVFNGPYPSMQKSFVGVVSDAVPVVHLDFDHGMITDVDEGVFASFRMSPNVMHAIGESGNGECVMAVAVVAKMFVENVEGMRAFLEALIGDEGFDRGQQETITELVAVRGALEERFLRFAPPSRPAGDMNVCEDWIDDIERLLEIGGTADLQPIEAIPWF
jgi:hypothetical protein